MRVRQRYVSKELTPHKEKISGNSLRINVGESGRISENKRYSPEVICFCDIPLDDLEPGYIGQVSFAE
jgi:hypothetical protein